MILHVLVLDWNCFWSSKAVWPVATLGELSTSGNLTAVLLRLTAKAKTVTSWRFEPTAINRDCSWIASPHADFPTFSWKKGFGCSV